MWPSSLPALAKEQNRLGIEDWSYWRSGSPLQYRPGRLPTRKKERVLISGCGDNGIVELMHYVFRDFEQEPPFIPAATASRATFSRFLNRSFSWRQLIDFERSLRTDSDAYVGRMLTAHW